MVDADTDNCLSIKGIFKKGEKQGKVNFFFRNLFLTFVVLKVDKVLRGRIINSDAN